MDVKTILIVDDDQGIRDALSELLEMEGFFVKLAIDGADGLKCLRQMQPAPDLVLLDVQMPEAFGDDEQGHDENADGEAMLSRDRARREAAWDKLESEFGEGKRVEGVIFGRVKGGFTVDIGGAVAFLPGSQVDIRPIKDVTPLMNIPQPFLILKMDRRRGNIVVSRRAIMEESRAEARGQLLDKIAEGQILDGIVKNITDYGAFIDMGGVDGLLHVTDISWKRINHPSEVFAIGDAVAIVRSSAERSPNGM